MKDLAASWRAVSRLESEYRMCKLSKRGLPLSIEKDRRRRQCAAVRRELIKARTTYEFVRHFAVEASTC